MTDWAHLLVRARGGVSPLWGVLDFGERMFDDDYVFSVPLDDDRLGLDAGLVDALRSWAAGGADYEAGLVVTRRLARHLGDEWVVRCWDERRGDARRVCWGCGLFYDEHAEDRPPHPVHLVVEGEFAYSPLRAEGFGDFRPDDPVAALELSEGLVGALRAWARDIDAALNPWPGDRADGAYESECARLFREGFGLAERVAREAGATRTVTYKGLANGGLGAMTSVSWRGDRQV
ncbi:hypothetical protein PV682_28290 [Streptomyces niveiscabiei]|uniref:hypothetical protein n=1 Tax=Streptomyces niveiscabiei TaxID=164115 RepID=UPI0029AB70F3|nr:hypothetical protein [Streptomyces niveiscabiei]MDX3385343.1 hypothetical protein [Streptomyces niveiscabiei]